MLLKDLYKVTKKVMDELTVLQGQFEKIGSLEYSFYNILNCK